MLKNRTLKKTQSITDKKKERKKRKQTKQTDPSERQGKGKELELVNAS